MPKINRSDNPKSIGRITSFHLSMSKWLLITRILQKYNKSLSSLIAEYIDNFIDVHIHVLYEDDDVHSLIASNPGISSGVLGEKLVEAGRNTIVKNYTGKSARLTINDRICKNFDENLPKVIDDGGQFK